MAFNFGALLKGGAAAARSIDNSRKQEKAEQMLLEDRLAQKEMRDLQKRKLEDELNRPASEPLEVVLDDAGQRILTPRSQASGRRAPAPTEPLEVILGQGGERVYTPRSQAAGKTAPTPAEPLVQVATPEGGSVYRPRSEAIGRAAPRPPAPGSAEIQKETNAAEEALALLDDIAADVEANGTDIDPRSTRRASLASKFAQFQLKLKDASKLGQLTESDMNIMLDVLNDPTSIKARGKALGSEATHRANVLAGANAARETLKRKLQSLGGGSEVPVVPRKGNAPAQDHSAMSDEEFAKAWAAGQFRKP